MKITCPHCGEKFEPYFSEGFVRSPERDPYNGEPLYDEQYTCYCPYCKKIIEREEIDESEQFNVDTAIAKQKHPEIFEDQEDVEEQDTEDNE